MQVYEPRKRESKYSKKRYIRKVYYWRIAFFISLVCVLVLVVSYFLIPKVVLEGSFEVVPQRYFFIVTSSHSNSSNADLAVVQQRKLGNAGFVFNHEGSYMIVSQTFTNEFSANLVLATLRSDGREASAKVHSFNINRLFFSETDINLYRLFTYPTLLYTKISEIQSELTQRKISSEAIFLAIENQANVLQNMFDEITDLNSPSYLKELYIEIYKAFKEFEKLSSTYSLTSALRNLQASIAYNYLSIFA